MVDSAVNITAGTGTPIRVLTALGAGSADQQVVTLADSAGNLLGSPVTVAKGTTGAGVPAAGALGFDGTNYQALKVDSAGNQLVAPSYLEVTGTAAALNADAIAATDVSMYRSMSLQVTGTWSGQLTLQISNDNTNWYSAQLLINTNSVASTFSNPQNNTLYWASVVSRYVRLRMTSYTSGTATATAEFSANPTAPPAQTIAGGVTASGTASFGGSDTNSTATGAVVVAPYTQLYNGSNWERARSFGTQGALGVTPTPGTTSGWSVFSQTALSTTVQAVKASQGTLGGYMIYNPNTVVSYVQVWNVASGSVTLGTTAPTYVLSIPPTSAANLELTCGVQHSTAIAIAATTTPTGSTAPTTALTAAIFYK